jgi:uncharacterized membrane protein YbhN (UPF0104 family)
VKLDKRRLLSILLTLIIVLFFIYHTRTEAEESSFSIQDPVYLLFAFILGVFAFLAYTASWYFILRDVGISFKRVLLLNLVGSYISISINSGLGALVKCRYLGIGWSRSLGTYAMVVVFELFPGLVVLLLTGSLSALVVVFLFIWAFIHEDSLYRVLYSILKIIRQDGFIREFYLGWKLAKRGNLPAAFLSSLSQVIFLALALLSTGRAFGIELPLSRALVAVLYSTVLGMIGTPGGIGANELGVTLALKSGASYVAVAFMYKLLTQYIYVIPGAFVFYRFLYLWEKFIEVSSKIEIADGKWK